MAPALKELPQVSGVDRSYRWGTQWVQEVAQRRRVHGGSGFIMSSPRSSRLGANSGCQ